MARGYVDPNWPDPNGSGDAPYIIYGYVPSTVLGVLGTVLFAISTLTHAFQLFRYHQYYFSVPVVIGATMEIVGYIFRTLSAQVDPYLIINFVLQYFFIVVAPVFFSAAVYAILSVLIKNLGRQYSPLMPPRWIIIVFVTCDVIATAVQVTGAALIGVAESNRKSPVTPNHILLGGLAFQVFSFFIYLVLLCIFLSRVKRVAMTEMRTFLVMYLLATLMIYLRTCFRLAETSEGVYHYLGTHEVFFGCLEFAPIVLAVFIFNIWHPGRCIPRHAQ